MKIVPMSTEVLIDILMKRMKCMILGLKMNLYNWLNRAEDNPNREASVPRGSSSSSRRSIDTYSIYRREMYSIHSNLWTYIIDLTHNKSFVLWGKVGNIWGYSYRVRGTGSQPRHSQKASHQKVVWPDVFVESHPHQKITPKYESSSLYTGVQR